VTGYEGSYMNNVDAIAHILKKEGVEWLACFPLNFLIEACSNAGIRPVVFRQERAGVQAAAGYSIMNAGRTPGVFCMQSGPGSENAYGGVAHAWSDGIPILLLPCGPPAETMQVPYGYWAAKGFGDITKSAETVVHPGTVPAVMRRAFAALRSGRPGPVMVEMPMGMQRQDYPGDIENEWTSPRPAVPRPSASDVKDAVGALLNAKTPVIWAGQGVLFSEATDELTEFAELTQVPVITSLPGKSAINENHPLALGSGGLTHSRMLWDRLQESDVVFAIGSSLTSIFTNTPIPADKFIIQGTIDPVDLGRDRPVDIPLLGDAKLTLRDMIDEVKGRIGETGRPVDTALQERIAQDRAAWLSEFTDLLTSDSEPINPYRLVWDLEQTLDHDNSVITHDAGNPRDQLSPFYRATTPRSYIGWGKSTHLGYGLGVMLGAKVACPDRFCVHLMGDAAFGMAGLDIETAVRNEIPITTVLMNNGIMGGYDAYFPESMERDGVGKLSGDYAKIAEGMGATGISVSKAAEFVPAVREAQRLNAEGETVLLQVYTQQEKRMSNFSGPPV